MPEVKYQIDSDTKIATFVIDSAGPVNTIGEQFIKDLAAATKMANRDNVNGVILLSGKKKSFLDGANLMEIMKDGSPFNLKYIVLKLQDSLSGLAKSPFPVAAVLPGQTALGGGFETLLWCCDKIFASPGTKLGLPEVNIGLFPAGGGPETLRRIVGVEKAVDIVMKGQVLPAEAYVDTGLVAMVPAGEGMAEAQKWLSANAGLVNRNYTDNWKDPGGLSVAEQKEVIAKARKKFCACAEKPYLRAAIDAMADGIGLPVEEASAKEVDYFAPLIADQNVKNKIDFFFLMNSIAPKLTRANTKKAVPAPEVAIIGAGLMGQGIAQVCADKGINVVLIDVDQQTAQAAKEKIEKGLEPLVQKGKWSAQRRDTLLEKIRVSDDYNELKNVSLVIEAVFEEIGLKRKILNKVQAINPDIVFASNTSTMQMQEIAAESSRPEQVVGMHYFSPVPLMPLLEVIQGPQTSEAALATALLSGQQQGKTCVVVGDGPGFYTSRTFGVYVMTGFCLAELGLDPWHVDRLALEAGFPQGPLNIYGTAGGNVIYHAGLNMQEKRPELMVMPNTLIRMYEAGYVGAGKPCFYKNGMEPDETARQFIVSDGERPTPDDEEAKAMLLLAMANQAFHCLDEGVVKSYYSMDLAAVLGIGFPDCWHGPARYVSNIGVKATLSRLQALYEKYTIPFFKPADEFERLAACGVDKGLV
ncbi:fatty oxidation complex subunit alpha [Desulfosarcina alkanivorans]|uniref:Fatty oxidation complex subunit alpha n=1 Tax=Desulfosarcina alkanivorans TaxID=571177 RepID=A0A5K7YG50_9BACT|nr:3-hydroxyacyl-CoA dehydrogenase NAD-binding domain-containing protein [Desulfosarcina alkanivorans]BBO68046.1 fatty oxidation complex subunit alpha [Desulfosarcina alkanivorans]